jgi:hypothetical protein
MGLGQGLVQAEFGFSSIYIYRSGGLMVGLVVKIQD